MSFVAAAVGDSFFRTNLHRNSLFWRLSTGAVSEIAERREDDRAMMLVAASGSITFISVYAEHIKVWDLAAIMQHSELWARDLEPVKAVKILVGLISR